MTHHFTVEVRRDDDRVIGWRCADVACTAAESVEVHEVREAAATAKAAEAAAAAAAKVRRNETVAWRCDGVDDLPGCGAVLRLLRWRAERRAFCCSACQRRASVRHWISSSPSASAFRTASAERAKRVPCAACSAKGAA